MEEINSIAVIYKNGKIKYIKSYSYIFIENKSLYKINYTDDINKAFRWNVSGTISDAIVNIKRQLKDDEYIKEIVSLNSKEISRYYKVKKLTKIINKI